MTSGKRCERAPTTTSPSRSISRHWLRRCSGISRCREQRSRPDRARVANGSLLLTDSPDERLADVIERLPGWTLDRRDPAELPNVVGTVAGTRVVYVTTSDPVRLRLVIERAHIASIPVVVGCADETV